MPEQALLGFVVGAWLLAGAVVLLARASAGVLTDPDDVGPRRFHADPVSPEAPANTEAVDETSPKRDGTDGAHSAQTMSPNILLLNVLVTQGGVIVLLWGGAVVTGVPLRVLGVSSSLINGATVVLGLGLGVGLYLVDEFLSVAARRLGYVPEELLRSVLTPESVGGWILLVSVILPLVALGEETLFRAALLGATPLVSGVPTVAILAISSILFGLAHAVQGRAGVVVAGVLGLGLGTAYLVTGNLLVVVLAHYFVNVAEFVVHEVFGFGVD